MKALITSDWHPDVVSYGVPRFNEIERAVHKTVETAIKERCTDYFFLGDLCDPDSGPVVFRCLDLAIRTAMFLASNHIHSHWLVGNHDVIEDGSGTSVLTPMRALGTTALITLYEEPTFAVGEDLSILALPFTPTSHGYNPAEVMVDFMRAPGKGIVLSHLSCPGIVPGEETESMPRGREVVLPLVELLKRPQTTILQGHYHTRQSHDGKLHIPGSLARLTFGEVQNDPSFLIMEI